VTEVRVSGVADFAELGHRWRELEQRADLSFFQSWTWVGCLAAERFPDPVLVEATEDGRTIALALFNRVRRRIGPAVLYLGENGSAELDCPYVEQNGVLAEAGREAELTGLCLRAVANRYDLVLSGVGDTALAAIRRSAALVRVVRSQPAPFVDLAALRAAGGDYLTGRSANTRQQIRRSDRFYGPIEVERAESVAAGHTMLAEMAALHQAAWTAKGQPGSFARPFFGRFHRELIASGMPRREIALLKVSCHGTVIGILYNFHFRGGMVAYQSGFAYSPAARQAKPGLTCHYHAICFALSQDLDIYDFLAGSDRYKRSLADAANGVVWGEAGPFWSPVQLFLSGAACVRRWVGEAGLVSGNFTTPVAAQHGGPPRN
jgi:CelD/BcsL family acetyltransferase involved in cellulose biosynthesis